MIVCKKCSFIVNGNLKYSIKANICPSCGAHLLNNDELRLIRDIEQDLLNNGFNFNAHTQKGLAVFILEKLSDKETGSYSDISKEKEQDDEGGEIHEINDSKEEDFISHAKSEIEKDLGIDKSSFSEEDLDDDNRVMRLRQMAKNNPILNKKGTVVRRVSGD